MSFKARACRDIPIEPVTILASSEEYLRTYSLSGQHQTVSDHAVPAALHSYLPACSSGSFQDTIPQATSSTTFLHNLEANQARLPCLRFVTNSLSSIAISVTSFAMRRISIFIICKGNHMPSVLVFFYCLTLTEVQSTSQFTHDHHIKAAFCDLLTLNGQAPFSSSYNTAGLRLATRFNAF